VDNTCCHAPIEENGQFRSTKHEGFGTGTASVRAIAQRHHGVTEFRYEDGIFYVSVFI
jgi:nitrogen-specific signal transduction histidine kinase